MDDLGRPSAAELSKFLGLTERTIYGYSRSGNAPRPVLLALFWESTYGRSHLDCEAFNARKTLQALGDSLARENAGLRARITRLEATADYGSANGPSWQPFKAAIGPVSTT